MSRPMIVAWICILWLAGIGSSYADSSYNHYRLPTSVRPEHYRLEINTHLNDERGFEFSGLAEITIQVLENANNITLHSKNLTIDQYSIQIQNLDDTEQDIALDSIEINPLHDYYILKLSKPLVKSDRYLLRMPFMAELNTNLFGYYRSVYTVKATGERRWMSITQFEPTAARLAFPCFDEPEMKAKFSIFLTHDRKFKAISNMPLINQTVLDNDWVQDEFQETVPMSTYLVAYSVNDFEYDEVTLKLKNDVVFRTWARGDAMSQVEYAGWVGPKVLEYYETVFGIKFPLPKIDQIAVPDFSAGAMENWGLVTYRETALLFAKNISSTSNKHRIASVISHELAHQWFGNLVTMKWWTDLWLNEGFATYIASLGVEHLHPEWDSLKEESVENTLEIFKVDALKSSHPISLPIKHANEISQIFDAISYSKGSCVLRMMHLFLGQNAFQEGVSSYLMKYAYKNAEQDNLWESLTETAHKLKTLPSEYDIKTIMDSWTVQTGYPVLTIKRNYVEGTAVVIQDRYLLDTSVSRAGQEECWWVPLSYTTEEELDFNNTQPKKWMDCDQSHKKKVEFKNISPKDKWIIFNIQLSGLYKVKYDARNWDMLIETLMSKNFNNIHIINRAQLIDDALDLAWTGDQDYDIAMRLIEYLRQEKEYIPWKAALDNLMQVNKILKKTSQYDVFKKYMKSILEPIYFTLGGLNSTENAATSERLYEVKHKVLISGWSCRLEVGDCIDRAIKYFKEWESTKNPDESNPIPTNLRSVVYCTAIRNGYENEWNFLWERYRSSGVASEKQTILSSLGCAREPWILQRYLEWGFDESENSEIRKQDAFIVFASVAHNVVGYPLAKDYLMKNIAKIYKYFDPDTTKISRLISPIASQMSSEREYLEMKNFTETNKDIFSKSLQGVRRALESIEINSQWVSRNFDGIGERLKNFIKMI